MARKIKSLRHSTPLAVAVAVLATLAIGVDGTQATEQISQTPIEPRDGASYASGTPITGPCEPTTPPTGPGRVTRTHGWSGFVARSRNEPGEHYNQAIRPTGEYNDGVCRAQERAIHSNGDVIGNGAPGFRAIELGRWEMVPTGSSTTWEYDDQDHTGWGTVDGFDFSLGRVSFNIYDPCYFKVTGVSGRVLKGQNGRRTETVRPGSFIGRGDILTVETEGSARGRVSLSGGAGNNLGFGPGSYAFSDNEACKKRVEGLYPSPVPQQPVGVEVKKGAFEQRSDEVRSSVKAGKDLWNDGIFSKQGQRRPRTAQAGEDAVEISFKVTRHKRERVTISCAREGRLRVRTSNRAVPKRKRELILRAGQCAKTSDGKAPRRVRR